MRQIPPKSKHLGNKNQIINQSTPISYPRSIKVPSSRQKTLVNLYTIVGIQQVQLRLKTTAKASRFSRPAQNTFQF